MKAKIGATERSSHIGEDEQRAERKDLGSAELRVPPCEGRSGLRREKAAEKTAAVQGENSLPSALCPLPLDGEPEQQFSDQEGPTSPLRHLTLTDFSFHNPVATSTVLAKRNAIIEVGGFDTSLRGPEDYDLWLRLAVKHRLALIDRPLSYYRQTPGSLSMDDRTFLPQVIRVLKKAYSPGGALFQQPNQRVSLAWQMLMGSWMAGERQAFGRAWIWFMKALWQWPLPFPRVIPNKWPRLKLMKALLWRYFRGVATRK
jgi:hypothetical protein